MHRALRQLAQQPRESQPQGRGSLGRSELGGDDDRLVRRRHRCQNGSQGAATRGADRGLSHMRLATVLRTVTLCLAAAAVLSAATGKSPVKPEDGYFTASDGVKIHYLTLGQKGTPVVLIHGYTGSAEGNWFSNGIAQALAKNHRVVAIDCRGHGSSEKPHDIAKYGADRMPEDVIEMMDHLNIPRAHIHGYSMGGAITGQLLAHHPERFITAAFGGSGIREADPEWIAKVPKDAPGPD